MLCEKEHAKDQICERKEEEERNQSIEFPGRSVRINLEQYRRNHKSL